MKFFVVVVLSLFLFVPSFAQQHLHQDSARVDSAEVFFSAADDYLFYTVDSSKFIHDLNNFQRFDPLADLEFYNYSGVAGGVYQPILFYDRSKMSFFDFFNEQSVYNLDYKNLKLFHNDIAFTRASYSSGYKKSQYFDLIHAQPLAKQWNLNLEYRLLGSPGAYKNQQAKHAHFRGVVQFRGDSSVYHAFAGFTQNNIYQKENGGIVSSAAFLDTLTYDRQLAKVNLYNAYHRYKKTEYFLRHGINLNAHKEKEKHIYVEHEFLLSHKYNSFVDTDTLNSFYYYTYDSIATNDSIRHRVISNSISIGNRNNDVFLWFAKGGYNLHKIYNTLSDSTLRELFAKVAFSINIFNVYNISAKGELSLVDSNNPDLLFDFAFNSADSLKLKPFANLKFNVYNPSVFLYKYNGNHFRIDFEPEQTRILSFDAGLKYRQHCLSAFGNSFNNLVYFTESSVNQGGNGFVYGVKYNGKFDFGRFSFRLNAIYQDVKNAQYVRVPDWAANAKLSMYNKIFGKALSLHLGFEVSIYDKYFADAYDPARQVFYMQNDIQTGNFLYPGVFIEAQIKRMCVFVEVQNFLADVTPVNYWQIPYYPLPDLAFRFGLSWTFFN